MTLLVDALHSLPRAAGQIWPAAARLLAHWLMVVLLALLTGRQTHLLRKRGRHAGLGSCLCAFLLWVLLGAQSVFAQTALAWRPVSGTASTNYGAPYTMNRTTDSSEVSASYTSGVTPFSTVETYTTVGGGSDGQWFGVFGTTSGELVYDMGQSLHMDRVRFHWANAGGSNSISCLSIDVSSAANFAAFTTVVANYAKPAGSATTVTFSQTASGRYLRVRWACLAFGASSYPGLNEIVVGGQLSGLTGNYYNTTDLTGVVAMSRLDGPVDFDWGAGSPGPGVNADYFSVRWTGHVLVPSTGWYTFQTQSDDGVRLWLNGQLIISNWTLHGPTDDTSAAVYLRAGSQYPVEMNMYEWGGGAVARLRWKRPQDTAFIPIPPGDGTQGLYPGTVAVVPDPGLMTGAMWWGRAGSIASSDNSDIPTWANEVDGSRNLAGSATRPKFRNNNAQNINFNPVVEFTSATASDAAAQFFSAPSFLGGSTWNQAHYALVGYPSSQRQGDRVLYEDAANPVGADGRLSIHWAWLDDRVFWDAGASGNGNRTFYLDTDVANKASIWLFNVDTATASPSGSRMGIRRDGLAKATSGAPAAFTGINANFRVGYGGVDSTFRGVLAEGMLFLGNTMSSNQATQLESYLGVKYGATVGGNGATGSSYLNSAGGTIWTANTGYHHNIVGIGRDDTTRLNQLISRSVNSGDQITIISGAAMPSAASVITPTTGATPLATDRSYTLIGDNGQSATGTASISVGAQAGRTRSSRIWRLQMTGTVPTQLSICIPDSMMPSGFTSGAWATDLWLTTATSADFSTGTANATMTATTCVASGVGVSTGVPGRVATISNTVLNGMGGVGFFTVTRRLLDHIEITASSNSGVTCAPTTYTVKACGDAACTTLYTGGLTGTLTLTGSGVTANFPSGAAFTIASGSSSTTVVAQVTTPSTATVGATGLSLTPANAKPVFCGLGVTANSTNACSMTVTDAGFLFSVPNHYAAANPSLVVKAVRKADDSLVCVPAFANVTRAVTATCSYLNPSTGTKPISFGWRFLNAANAAGAACDASGRPVYLAFDYEGKTSAYLSYGDVGSMRLNLSFTGSGSEAGLVLNGSASFITAPISFMMGSLPSGQQVAGGPFNFTVTAVGWNNVVTPNFGREAVPAGISLAHVRTAPQGVNAVDGVLQATPGAFSNGVSTVSNASWSEVGQISLTATLTGNNYLGTGLTAGGGTGIMNWTYCSADNATCTLPAGVTAAVHYGSSAFGFIKTGQSGSLPCNTTNFGGDPFPGGLKACYYTPLSGVGTATPHVTFKPHHFDVSTTTACGSFSYAGQPFGVTVTAKNLADSITQNYDGTTNTSPNFAKAVSLSDITASPPGSLSGSLAASAFNRGVASVAAGGANAPVYSFSNKLTAPQSISLRATDTDGVSSNGFTEGSMALRSGRLQMSNAFGGDKSALQIPIQLQYWSGNSWVRNSADTCTVIPTASVVRARTLNHNNSTATWSSAISGVSLSGGSGFITLGAPSPSGTGTVDLSINLGSSSTGQSCLAANPSSTGAGLPWLRSRQGNCASTFDRDPSARATFGVYAPETQRSVHVREVF